MNADQPFRKLPAIDSLLRRKGLQILIEDKGREAVRDGLRKILDDLRSEFQGLPNNEISNFTTSSTEELGREIERRINIFFQRSQQSLTQRVINATGVVLHTNLGRAPLSQNAIAALVEAGRSYCNLEYDLESGKRGKRGAELESMLRNLFGCEAAAIVNNCAAAVYLTLNTLAEGGEVLVSRGELIEIGGSFRLPDVIVKSGAQMREVGTTNRTRLGDFENAITENTRIILRSHPSNYRLVGFTERPSLAELTALATKKNIPLFEDLGSGALIDLSPAGIHGEPTVQETLKAGASLVAFSADKLLGGPQAGIILGKKDLIERIKRNPMMRAFRVDKLIFSALEATIAAYVKGDAITTLPALTALHTTKDEIARRAQKLMRRVANANLKIKLIDGNSVVGGGSAPEATLPTKLISITSDNAGAGELESYLRCNQPPIIARIEENQLLIDLRTVTKTEENEISEALNNLS